MNFTLVEIDELSGDKLKVYSIITDEDAEDGYTLYDKFVIENEAKFNPELIDITNRIEVMAKHTGLRSDFIKEGEGILGDEVVHCSISLAATLGFILLGLVILPLCLAAVVINQNQ